MSLVRIIPMQMTDSSAKSINVNTGQVFTDSIAMLRLFQLVSPALPIGAYNFSQGLEYAVDAGWVSDEETTRSWILGIAGHGVATLDLPVLFRLQEAWLVTDLLKVGYWSRYLVASRETEELRAEERHLGRSLAKVLVSLGINEASHWGRHLDASYACLFALAATRWSISAELAAQGYLWAWCENQVMAALKLLPLGQSAGQRILNKLLPSIPSMVATAIECDDEDIGIATPLQSMACAWHESQYTRLFRS